MALLLLGTRYVRSRWLLLATIGILWACLGLAVFIDALADVRFFPLQALGILFLFEGFVTLIGAATGLLPGSGWYLRSVILIVIGALVLARNGIDDFILAMLFGAAFLVDGCLRIASAAVVRYRGWRFTAAGGVLELLFAVFMFEPLPTYYHGTLPYCIGAALLLSGWGLLQIALQLRTMPQNALLSLLSSRDRLAIDGSYVEPSGRREPTELTVHVWTALGTARDPVHRPLVDRYIAAVDAKGNISTGHCALEVLPDTYISHYPALDIDRSTGDFARLLRASVENNVAGRFLPSYREESAEWCASTVKIGFARYNFDGLRAFWNHYRLDNTYNLTNRNCSSTVAHALETALEGTLADRKPAWFALLAMLGRPEFWVAGQIRARAETMAWTPGLVLDYARALQAILHPHRRAWLGNFSWKPRRHAITAAQRNQTIRDE